MRQLTLDVLPAFTPSLENFLPGGNAAALAALRSACSDGGTVLLWGSPGSGRSHLLQAAVAAARARGQASTLIDAAAPDCGAAAAAADLLAIDNLECADEALQARLFHLLVSEAKPPATLLYASACPPQGLPLREDLRTRIAQALVFCLQPLSDDDKLAALLAHAHGRGLALGDEVLRYLLRHGRRDLHWLTAAIDALDEASLALGRAPSLPLLKAVIGTPRE